MTFWQRIAVVVVGLASGIAIQVLIKDPSARASLTGVAGTLVGWMMKVPGSADGGPPIPPPPRMPTLPETPEAKR